MMESKEETAALIESVQQEYPYVVDLARAISLAVRVEPELLRSMRLDLLPVVDAGTEADLWFSPLVQAENPLVLALVPAVEELLRQKLSEDQEFLNRARNVLQRVHMNAPPALRMEEEVTWLALSDRPDASQRIEELLLSAVVAIVEEERYGLARWAARALPRLPELARKSPAAWTLAIAAGTRLDGRRIAGVEVPSEAIGDLLQRAIPKDSPRVPIGIRLLEGRIEFGEPSMHGAHSLELPKTNPLLLEVAWQDNASLHSVQEVWSPGRTRTIQVGPGKITLRTALGEVYTLGAKNYLPFPRNPLFQSQPGELEQLESLLVSARTANQLEQGESVGIVGIGGIGKTELAIELAYRNWDQHRFPAGIFWMPASGTNPLDWQRQLAELTVKLDYLPPDDDLSNPENETRRARYLCRYLARHADALLILDGVEEPNLISALPSLAGRDLACSILYTSRIAMAPPNTTIFSLNALSEENALHLLLETTRPPLLNEILTGSRDAEAQGARTLCRSVGYLPLPLMLLRELLANDKSITLVRLAKELERRGALDITNSKAPLFAAFRLSWEQVQTEEARRLFLLASYFPEAESIPLWLLGLATGLGEEDDIFAPLGQARLHLQKLSLLEVLSDGYVRLHPLVREFGQHLVAEDGHQGTALLKEAEERLTSEFTDLNRLESRALASSYQILLEQVHATLAYIRSLGTTSQVVLLERIERWLAQENHVLGDKRWWPQVIPSLFYQQLYNRSVAEGQAFTSGKAPQRWLRLERELGVRNPPQSEKLADHAALVTCITFSPPFGEQVLIGLEDGTAQLWDIATGKRLFTLTGSGSSIQSLTVSPDARLALTGYADGIARLWDILRGQLLATFEGHTGRINSVAFSPDARLALTGSEDGTAQLWDIPGGRLLFTLTGSGGSIQSLTVSPDARLALIGSADGIAQLWDIASGQLLATFEGHTGRINSVAFSPDARLALTGSENGTAQLWDIATGKRLITLESPGGIQSLTFSPDARLAASCDANGWIFFWSVTGSAGKYPQGLYVAPYEAGAIQWQRPNMKEVALIDKGGPESGPTIHQLMMEGTW